MTLNKIIVPILGWPRLIKRVVVLLLDITMCIFATLASFYLRLGLWLPLFSNSEWTPLLVASVSIALAIPIFIGFGLYREIFRHSGWMALLSLLRATILYAVLFFLIFTLVGIQGAPRTIGLIQPLVLLIFVGASRAVASYLLSNAYRHELKLSHIPNVLIYGAGNAGIQLAGALSHDYEMKVVGFLDDDPAKQGQKLVGKRVYSPNNLLSLVADLNVSGVLLAIPSANRYRRNQILKLVRDAKVSIQTLPSLSDLAQGKVNTQELRPLDIDDLLSRDPVIPDRVLMNINSYQKIVLITGAGGSIGSEICRQIIDQNPKSLVLVDQNEFSLYQIHQELINRLMNTGNPNTSIIPILASVTNKKRISAVMDHYCPDVIYHAAAYKHVPLVELNIFEGARNNIIGTLTLAKIAIDYKVPSFILISTDKAVRPTNVMGASKRVAELILQALAETQSDTCFSMVRFGNVLDSSGSVVPKFREQIKNGGPVTLTDRRVTRFFMTIPEAAQLVIQAGAMANGGDVFLLDMGEPVHIMELAKRMILLSGYEVRSAENPNGDIEIIEVGLRPGEKLYEELLIEGGASATFHPKIFKAHEDFLAWEDLQLSLAELEVAIASNDQEGVITLLKDLVPGFNNISRQEHIPAS